MEASPRPPPARRGRRLKNHLLYGLARLLLWLLAALPTRLALGLGRGLGRAGYWVAAPERRRAQRNLQAVMPGLDARARRRLLETAFGNLGESVAECAQLSRLRPRLAGLMSLEPGAREVLEAARAEGNGLVVVTGHFGNWELMAAALARLVPAAVLFKPSYDSRFTRLLCELRRASGIRSLDVTRAGHLREAIGLLRQGSALGLLIDQPPPPGAASELVTFLGRPALATRLVPVLVRRTGAAVVFAIAQRTGTCQHRLRVMRLEDPSHWRDPGTALRTVAGPLEAAILGAPEQWTWSLDRWRGASLAQKSSAYCK